MIKIILTKTNLNKNQSKLFHYECDTFTRHWPQFSWFITIYKVKQFKSQGLSMNKIVKTLDKEQHHKELFKKCNPEVNTLDTKLAFGLNNIFYTSFYCT